MRRALTEAVTKAFETRQEVQHAELARFEARLRSLRQTLERREQLKQRIIERRVEDLISEDNLNWSGASHPKRPAGFGTLGGSTTSNPGFSENRLASNPFSANSRKKPQSEPAEVEVLPIRQLDAADVVEDVRTLISEDGNAQVDPKNNVIIIRGKRKEVEAVKSLIDIIEKQRKNTPAEGPDGEGPLGNTGAIRGGSVSDAATPGVNITRMMKSPTDFRNAIQSARKRLELGKKLLADTEASFEKKEDTRTKAKLAELASNIAEHERRLMLAVASYQTQLRLLELDVEEAESALSIASSTAAMIEKLAEKGAASQSELRKQEATLKSAGFKLKRAQALFELYEKAEKDDVTKLDEGEGARATSKPRTTSEKVAY